MNNNFLNGIYWDRAKYSVEGKLILIVHSAEKLKFPLEIKVTNASSSIYPEYQKPIYLFFPDKTPLPWHIIDGLDLWKIFKRFVFRNEIAVSLTKLSVLLYMAERKGIESIPTPKTLNLKGYNWFSAENT